MSDDWGNSFWNPKDFCNKRQEFFEKYFDVIDQGKVNENCFRCPIFNITSNKRLCDDVEKDFLIFKRKKKLEKLLL